MHQREVSCDDCGRTFIRRAMQMWFGVVWVGWCAPCLVRREFLNREGK